MARPRVIKRLRREPLFEVSRRWGSRNVELYIPGVAGGPKLELTPSEARRLANALLDKLAEKD